jgi:WD repeat-containing protein 48
MNRESGTPLNPSTSSVHTATVLPQANPTTLTTLFGVPYQSLIKLSSPADGFASPLFGRIKDPDVATLYSAASIRSIPIPMRQLTLKVQAEPLRPINLSQPPPGLNSVLPRSMASMDGNTLASPISTGQLGHKAVQSVDDIEDAARIAYETREIAPEALPIRDRPDYVLQGAQGIVRSVVLNDRWHALTVDTMGHVGVWDIVRGKCVGMFEKCDVEKTHECENTPDGQKWKWSPREALEVVRERIEGEAVVNAWCTVDSSIGNLMVHIESNRVFDAEIFGDEAGYQGDIQFEEDHRCEYCAVSSPPFQVDQFFL